MDRAEDLDGRRPVGEVLQGNCDADEEEERRRLRRSGDPEPLQRLRLAVDVLQRRDGRLGLIRPVKPAIQPTIPSQDTSPVSMPDRRSGHQLRSHLSGKKLRYGFFLRWFFQVRSPLISMKLMILAGAKQKIANPYTFFVDKITTPAGHSCTTQAPCTAKTAARSQILSMKERAGDAGETTLRSGRSVKAYLRRDGRRDGNPPLQCRHNRRRQKLSRQRDMTRSLVEDDLRIG
ncbi:hypothetical protein PKCBPO_00809 [Methylorubrum thiocyanatum]